MSRGLITLFAILCLLYSCDNKVYDKYNHTAVKGWEKNDTLTFAVPKIRETGMYGINLGLRINNGYPFIALSLIVEQTIYPDKTLKSDTLNCKLINRNGNPKGHGISYYQYDFNVDKLYLRQGDSLYITVRHDMKREILPGISDVGIQIKK